MIKTGFYEKASPHTLAACCCCCQCRCQHLAGSGCCQRVLLLLPHATAVVMVPLLWAATRLSECAAAAHLLLPVPLTAPARPPAACARQVTEIEAARLEESREEREAFLRQLRAELERQAADKGVKLRLPPLPGGGGGGGAGGGGGGGGSGPAEGPR